jgi:TolA-binding protein
MMQRINPIRKALTTAATITLVLGLMPIRAHAASKEIIQLQTQVQQLLDMVQRIQSTLDTKFGVLQNLAQQTADQATQMSATVTALQQKINAQNEALGGKVDTASGQIQSLNDSVDELKTRIAKLDKSIQDLQSQLQNIQNPPQAAGTAQAAPGAPDAGQPAPMAGPSNAPGMSAAPAPASSAALAPPLEQTYQAAVRDFNAAKYSVAKGEFQDVVHYYPLDNMAGTSQFYLGEIAYRQKDYESAIKSYNGVLEGFSGNSKAAAAQLHKGLALMQVGRRDAGIHELRELIQRHPQTPEAAQARAKLNGMGVRINPHIQE